MPEFSQTSKMKQKVKKMRTAKSIDSLAKMKKPVRGNCLKIEKVIKESKRQIFVDNIDSGMVTIEPSEVQASEINV